MQGSTVYPCEEYGEVAVPIYELLTEGKVDVYPEVTGRGLFDIDFRRGHLILVAKSFVGLIPINPRVSIHVAPRVPVGNVLYLVQRANRALQYLPGYKRSYEIKPESFDSIEGVFAASFFECLLEIEKTGLLHKYISYDSDRDWRGRVLLAATVNRYVSKGIRFRQVRRVTELSVDIPENQLVKDTLVRMIRYWSQFSNKTSIEYRKRASYLLKMFDRISNIEGNRQRAAQQCLRSIRQIPGDHKEYEELLWLCYLIATRQGLSIESFGALQVRSLIVNLADIFESYIREILKENIEAVLAGGILRDGNKHQVPLFVHGQAYRVKPDIYVEKEGRAPIVMDAKYKPSLKAADRYEVISFCEALQSKIAILVFPAEPGSRRSTFLGRTPGGIEMYDVRIDLSANNIRQEEFRFLERLHVLVNRG